MEKKRRFDVAYGRNARAYVRALIFEMLKMTWFVLSFGRWVILSIFKFWRARTRPSWPLHDLCMTWPDMAWPEVYVT